MNRPALEVADVVRQYGAAYLARYGSTLSPEQHRALRAIAVCRTAALGGHAAQCEQCGHVEITYNSCGNRHCPKCPGRAQAAWLAAREAELLDVPYYFQTVVMESHQDIHVHFLILTFFGLSITAACPPTAN
jgi:uncharacterized protein (UPF0212 family)